MRAAPLVVAAAIAVVLCAGFSFGELAQVDEFASGPSVDAQDSYNRFVRGVNNGDVDVAVSAFAEDAAIRTPIAGRVEGKDAIRAWVETVVQTKTHLSTRFLLRSVDDTKTRFGINVACDDAYLLGIGELVLELDYSNDGSGTTIQEMRLRYWDKSLATLRAHYEDPMTRFVLGLRDRNPARALGALGDGARIDTGIFMVVEDTPDAPNAVEEFVTNLANDGARIWLGESERTQGGRRWPNAIITTQADHLGYEVALQSRDDLAAEGLGVGMLPMPASRATIESLTFRYSEQVIAAMPDSLAWRVHVPPKTGGNEPHVMQHAAYVREDGYIAARIYRTNMPGAGWNPESVDPAMSIVRMGPLNIPHSQAAVPLSVGMRIDAEATSPPPAQQQNDNAIPAAHLNLEFVDAQGDRLATLFVSYPKTDAMTSSVTMQSPGHSNVVLDSGGDGAADGEFYILQGAARSRRTCSK